MKKIIVIGVLALLLVLFKAQSQTRSAWRVLHATNASITLPKSFVSGVDTNVPPQTNIYATRVTIIGKSSPRTTNANIVWIGPMTNENMQPYPVAPAGEVVLRAPDTAPFNLRDWYFDVQNGFDGVTIIFQ